MNRRNFLAWFFGSAAVSIVVPKLVAAPSLRGFHRDAFAFIYQPAGRNRLLTEMLSREALYILRQNLAFTVGVNRAYEADFMLSVGETINIRKPQRFVNPA